MDDRLALERLAAAIIDDIMSMTDEELLAEVEEDGEDPQEIARITRSLLYRTSGPGDTEC